jgi:hypothetical protein
MAQEALGAMAAVIAVQVIMVEAIDHRLMAVKARI